MDYFILQQDQRSFNTIHLPILSLLSYTDYKNYNLASLPCMTVIPRRGSKYEEYPDLLSAIFMVSEELNELISLFMYGFEYKLFCFWDEQKNLAYYYYAYDPPALNCLSERSIIKNGGTVISRAVLKCDLMQDKDIVRVKDLEMPLILVSLPVAEAILRRNYKGIRLIETYIEK